MKLRPYQQDAEDKIFESIKKGNKKLLFSAATGCGKTILAKDIARVYIEKNQKVIFVAPRTNLVDQTIDKFQSLGFIDRIQAAHKYNEQNNLFVASFQTMGRRNFEMTPSIIIWDEYHLGSKGKTAKSIFKKFPNSIFLCLTATPFDKDGYPLSGFDDIIETLSVHEFIKQDFLVGTKCYAPVSVDLSNVKVQGGDFNEKELDQLMNNSTLIDNVVKNTKEHIENLKTIVFSVTIDHCENLAKQYRDAGFIAEAYHSKINWYDRSEILRKFSENKIQILVSVSTLTLGFDEPAVACIIIARPTKSKPLFYQIIGRGLRPYPGKTNCLILDCANAIKTNCHGDPTAPIIPRKRNKRRNSDFASCNKCDQKAVIVSRSIKKIDGITHYLNTYACKNNHIFEIITQAKGTICKECKAVIINSNFGHRETEKNYEMFVVCQECGADFIFRQIEKIHGKLEAIKIAKISKYDVIEEIREKIKTLSKQKKEKIESFIKFILSLDEEVQKENLSSILLQLSMNNFNKIGPELRNTVKITAVEKGKFNNLPTEMITEIYEELKDPMSVLKLYNSRYKYAMSDRFLTRTLNKIEAFIQDFPSAKKNFFKAIKTRCENIRKNNQKLASVFYFIDFLREKEEEKKKKE